MKQFTKNNKKYILIFIMILFISFFFPFSGDDFYWGSKTISIKEYINIYNDLFLNGRWLSNSLAILISHSHILKALFISIILTLLYYLIEKNEKINPYIFFILIILMPLVRFSQSIVWGSGFVNYGSSTLLYLLIYYTIKKYYNKDSNKYTKILLFILCLLSSLILENITLAIDIMLLISNIIYYKKNKKLNKTLITMFIGSIIGTILMFIHPSYLNIVNDNSVNERYFPSNSSYLKYVLESNISYIFYYLFLDNTYLNFFFLILMFYLTYKNKISFKLCLFYILIFILSLITNIIELNYLIVILCGIIYSIGILYILYKLVKYDKKIIEYIGLIILNVIPLIIVKPIGERLFFLSYIIEILILFRVIDILKIELKYNYIYKIILIILYIIYTFIYITTYKYEIKRDNYIKENQEKSVITIEEAPFKNFVWWYNITDEFPNKYYNLYHGYSNITYMKK